LELRALHFDLDGAWQGEGRTDGVAFHVVCETGGERVELFQRLLRPREAAGDRGMQQFSVAVDAAAGSVLALVADCGPQHDGAWDWSYWTGIRIQ